MKKDKVMIQVGVKFSSKPRNGYDYIYQIVGEKDDFYKVKNTSFPEYDERSVARLQSKREIEERFASKDYIILKK
tara:strand:+ start:2119 stop:2343 length:225 start_codon:yes stop_codon:yes gene_type:complete